MDKYQEFLESIKQYNPTLVEGVSKAYTVIFEEMGNDTPVQKRMSLAERRAAKKASPEAPTPAQPQRTQTEPRWLSRSDMTQSKYMDRLDELGYPPEIKEKIIELIRQLRWISEESKKTTSSGKSVASMALEEINRLEKNVILGLPQVNQESLNDLVDYVGNVVNKWNIDLVKGYSPEFAEPVDDEVEEDDDYNAAY